MPRAHLFDWLEHWAFALGVSLLAWTGLIGLERSFIAKLPVPPPALGTSPPGETATRAAAREASGTPRVEQGAWLARLEAPSVGLEATVLAGTDETTLRRGAGHIEGTPAPGAPGNVGIAGHRDTVFRPVRRLTLGDPLFVTTRDRVLEYRVAEMKIVNPEDVYVLNAMGRSMLTLVTCFPFNFVGSAPQRYIVHAELIEERVRTPQVP